MMILNASNYGNCLVVKSYNVLNLDKTITAKKILSRNKRIAPKITKITRISQQYRLHSSHVALSMLRKLAELRYEFVDFRTLKFYAAGINVLFAQLY